MKYLLMKRKKYTKPSIKIVEVSHEDSISVGSIVTQTITLPIDDTELSISMPVNNHTYWGRSEIGRDF